MFSELSIEKNKFSQPYHYVDDSLAFSDYIAETQLLIKNRRMDLNDKDSTKIIEVNSPYELKPKIAKPKSAALLIHGLWDSPFSLKEIALLLHQNDILCRSILLPGHGTRPADLEEVTYQQWIKVTEYGVNSLLKEASQVFLIGYSAGALLSLHHALQNKKIAGVVALAPAIRINPFIDMVFDWHYFTRWFSKNKHWIYLEDETDYAKYRSIGFNPALQIFKLTKVVKELYENEKLSCPLFMALSEDDETISAKAAIEFFSNLKHARNQLILYTNKQNKIRDKRIISRTSRYPNLSIENFSHVSIPFSPNNIHYGANGDYKRASHHSNMHAYGAYNRIGENFYRPFFQLGLIKKCKRELTYNPDFEFMTNQLVEFITS